MENGRSNLGLGNLGVIQPADVGERHLQIERRLIFWSKKNGTIPPLILPQFYIESLLDVGDRPAYFQQLAVWASVFRNKTMGPGEIFQGPQIHLRGSKIFGELVGGEETAVLGTMGVFDLPDQFPQGRFVAQG